MNFIQKKSRTQDKILLHHGGAIHVIKKKGCIMGNFNYTNIDLEGKEVGKTGL